MRAFSGEVDDASPPLGNCVILPHVAKRLELESLNVVVCAKWELVVEQKVVLADELATAETLETVDMEALVTIVLKALSLYETLANPTDAVVGFVEMPLTVWLVVKDVANDLLRESELALYAFEAGTVPLSRQLVGLLGIYASGSHLEAACTAGALARWVFENRHRWLSWLRPLNQAG